MMGEAKEFKYATIKIRRQDEKNIYVKIYAGTKDLDWHEVNAIVRKDKLKKI
jgi:hypothetical protein